MEFAYMAVSVLFKVGCLPVPEFYHRSSFHFLSTSFWICSDGLQTIWRAVNCFWLIEEIIGRLMGNGFTFPQVPWAVCVCVCHLKEMGCSADRYAAVCSIGSRGMCCSQYGSISTHRDKTTHTRGHTYTDPEIK